MSTSGSSNPGNWIIGSYTGDSDALKITIAAFIAVAWYNAIELIILIFKSFTHYNGIYFWSMLISAGVGIPLYSVGFLVKFFDLTSAIWLSITLVTIGWWAMVTGQAFVLYSRLHLILQNPMILRLVLNMIVANIFLLHVPTTVLSYAANFSGSHSYVTAYNVMERIQVAGFCVQELIISGLYMWETYRMLKINPLLSNRKIIIELFIINMICVLMGLGLVAVESANYYIYQTTLKATVYSIKLKVEFGVLGRLVLVATGSTWRP
ncbi:hypothetical protein BDV33DRAFT_230682 [Aspergillus novoparasiticus]|uniref:DUF7703 domain-containing protein n=1 Tax=Aspergillus novoparasiticus TaxID=986946 RepID=A0A5N6E7C6_9EURO|nr:hypothetical protein BDV33DRAFT_230682 [Aspergillus novoparasiticus]